MRSFKNAEIAYIKVTQEPVFVLNIDERDEGPAEVFVRRPTKGQHGVSHNKEYFFEDELASFEELLKMGIEQDALQDKILRTAKKSTTIDAIPAQAKMEFPN